MPRAGVLGLGKFAESRVRARLAGLATLVCLAPVAAHAGGEEATVAVRWLGVAGFSLEAGGVVLLHDPYLSRPGLWRTLATRYRPDPAVLEPLLAATSPAPELVRARLVLIGHSHFDHLGDAPWLALHTGARLAGTATSAHIARAYGMAPGDTVVLSPGESLREGPFTVQAFPSRHAEVWLGRVPFPGELSEDPEAPLHAFSFPMGGALAYLVTVAPGGARIFLLSSAALDPEGLETAAAGGPVDLLLVAVSGRAPGFTRTLIEALRPRRVVPHHYGNFLRPLDAPDAVAPVDPEDLAAFEAEVAAAAAAAGLETRVERLGLFERTQVSP